MATIVSSSPFSRQVFIGNLCHISVETLRNYCEKFGSVTEFSINREKKENIYHCFAFVTFHATSSTKEFMAKRPHRIHDQEIFVKRALTRAIATIPERVVVTNRLVVSNSHRFARRKLRRYFKNFGSIRNLDYENGWIDFDDYDPVDCVIISRPHYLHDEEIQVTKIIPTEADVQSCADPEENFRKKFENLKKQFEEYQRDKERELTSLRNELKRIKEDISDITQIKLDKVLKNQQMLFEQMSVAPLSPSAHAQMCREFVEANVTKKRKSHRES